MTTDCEACCPCNIRSCAAQGLVKLGECHSGGMRQLRVAEFAEQVKRDLRDYSAIINADWQQPLASSSFDLGCLHHLAPHRQFRLNLGGKGFG